MIAFVCIATICTGLVAAGSVAYFTECPNWAIAVIYVIACAGMCAALNIWLRRETKGRTDCLRQIIRSYCKWAEALTKRNDEITEEKFQLLQDLKAADIDCIYCKHAKDEEITRKCIDQDCDCDKCEIECPCKTCVNKSNWKWTGVQKDA